MPEGGGDITFAEDELRIFRLTGDYRGNSSPAPSSPPAPPPPSASTRSAPTARRTRPSRPSPGRGRTPTSRSSRSRRAGTRRCADHLAYSLYGAGADLVRPGADRRASSSASPPSRSSPPSTPARSAATAAGSCAATCSRPGPGRSRHAAHHHPLRLRRHRRLHLEQPTVFEAGHAQRRLARRRRVADRDPRPGLLRRLPRPRVRPCLPRRRRARRQPLHRRRLVPVLTGRPEGAAESQYRGHATMTAPTACQVRAFSPSTALPAVPALAGDRLPTGGSVAHGSVDISTPAANAMAIRQSSDTAIVNWQGFSIGAGRARRHPPALGRLGDAEPRHRLHALDHRRAAQRQRPGLPRQPERHRDHPDGHRQAPAPSSPRRSPSPTTTSSPASAASRASGQSAAVVNQGAIEIGRGRLRGADRRQGRRTAGMVSVPPRQGRPRRRRAGDPRPLRRRLPAGRACRPSTIRRRRAAHPHSPAASRADGGRVEIKAATARADGAPGHQPLGSCRGAQRRRALGRHRPRRRRRRPRHASPAGSTPARPRAARRSPRSPAAAPRHHDHRAPHPPRARRRGPRCPRHGRRRHDQHRRRPSGQGDLQRAATTSLDADDDDPRRRDPHRATAASVVVWSDERTDLRRPASPPRGGPLGGDGGSAEVSGKALARATPGFADLSARQGRLRHAPARPRQRAHHRRHHDRRVGECRRRRRRHRRFLDPIDADDARFFPSQASLDPRRRRPECAARLLATSSVTTIDRGGRAWEHHRRLRPSPGTRAAPSPWTPPATS